MLGDDNGRLRVRFRWRYRRHIHGRRLGKALIPALIAAAIPAAGALGSVAASAAQSLLLIPAAAEYAGLATGNLLWLPGGSAMRPAPGPVGVIGLPT